MANQVLGKSLPASEPAALVPVPAKDFGLPIQWKTFYLREPIFDGKIFIAEVGNRSNPTVFLVHGLGQNGMNDWLTVVPSLEKKYHVILIDLPGFARSDKPKAKLTPTRYSELLHYVKPFFCSEPLIVVGHSMGGAVALRYSFAYPGDVRKLLLVDAAGILQRTAFVKHSVTDHLPIDELSGSNPLLGFAMGLQNVGTGLIEKLLSLPDPTTLLGDSDLAWGVALSKTPNINAALGLIEENFSQAIYELQQPVAMLWGADDAIAPTRTSKLLSANLRQSTLAVIEGAGHVPMATHSDQFNRWITSALESDALTTTAVQIDNDDNIKSNGDYRCENEEGGTLSGRFDHLVVTGCVGLRLTEIIAQDIVLNNSVVQMNEVTLSNSTTSVTAEDSTLVATSSSFSGKIKVKHSRLDLAGIQFHMLHPFIVSTKSRLILSVNRARFAGATRYFHADIAAEVGEY